MELSRTASQNSARGFASASNELGLGIFRMPVGLEGHALRAHESLGPAPKAASAAVRPRP